MTAFLLTWDPKQSELSPHQTDWSIGVRRSGIAPGDRGFFFRTRRERGIVATCRFTGDIWIGPDFRGGPRSIPYAELQVDDYAGVDERLPVEDLKRRIPEVNWDRLQGSGIALAEGAGRALERLWQGHRGRTRRGSFALPSERNSYTEGTSQVVRVNRYERSQQARQKCIKRYGTACVVCGFDFGEHYPGIGEGFIEVHHLKDLAGIGRTYQVDPVRDLRPVCANCHQMLHRGVDRPRSIATLRRLYRS